MRILILGGYGVFGGRLVELLGDVPEIEMIVGGRNAARAEAFCERFVGHARVKPMRLPRDKVEKALTEVRPDLLVDASGPFQNYGNDPYGVVRACVANGVHYMDFADGADFVFGISQFDAEARAANVFVLSGVSSFPVLTAAVLRRMAQRLQITPVEGGIAPSPYAGIGLNVMGAVLGYAGAPVRLWRDGKQAEARGLTESRRYTIAVPGKLPLHNIRFSLVDVPDLQVIPPEHDGLRDIWMGAGPVPEILHRMLNVLAKTRATLRLPSLAPMAGLFHRVLNLMQFGEHRGGMYVEVKGVSNGSAETLSWHLLAEGDDGPYIPSMAIEAVVRKYLRGERPVTGARPAVAALELEDYEHLFEKRDIWCGFRAGNGDGVPLYRQVLGSAFDDLPSQVKTLHDAAVTRDWVGAAQVRRGPGVLARIVAAVFGFPKAAESVPVRVTLSPEAGGERWLRNFDGKRFSSYQSRGRGRDAHLLIERFGIIAVALAMVVEDKRLYLIPRRWSALGLPLPRMLLPKGASFETQEDGCFVFDVEISAPLVGLIVTYRGKLRPE